VTTDIKKLEKLTKKELVTELLTVSGERDLYKSIADHFDSDEFWNRLASAAAENDLCHVFDETVAAVGLKQPMIDVEVTEARTYRFGIKLIDLYRIVDGSPDEIAGRIASDLTFFRENVPYGMTKDDITSGWLLTENYGIEAEECEPIVTGIMKRRMGDK